MDVSLLRSDRLLNSSSIVTQAGDHMGCSAHSYRQRSIQSPARLPGKITAVRLRSSPNLRYMSWATARRKGVMDFLNRCYDVRLCSSLILRKDKNKFGIIQFLILFFFCVGQRGLLFLLEISGGFMYFLCMILSVWLCLYYSFYNIVYLYDI